MQAVCAKYPVQFREACRQARVNALLAGQCDRLTGCDAQVCNDQFANGVYPRLMPRAKLPLNPPKRVYAYGSYPQVSEAAYQLACQSWQPRFN
jgi:hypothetical protein